MTEAEWTACDEPRPMLQFCCAGGKDRKLRLFAVACSRRVVPMMSDERSRRAVEVSERYADGLVGRKALAAARWEAFAASKVAEHSGNIPWSAASHAAVVALNVCANHQWRESRESLLATAGCASSLVGHTSGEVERAEMAIQCLLLRDVFGNPFRPVTFDAAWRSSDVMLLAEGIYGERAFDQLPILADALQDAGCDSDDILDHLRDEKATHVRGCWALDLVLGKE